MHFLLTQPPSFDTVKLPEGAFDMVARWPMARIVCLSKPRLAVEIRPRCSRGRISFWCEKVGESDAEITKSDAKSDTNGLLTGLFLSNTQTDLQLFRKIMRRKRKFLRKNWCFFTI